MKPLVVGSFSRWVLVVGMLTFAGLVGVVSPGDAAPEAPREPPAQVKDGGKGALTAEAILAKLDEQPKLIEDLSAKMTMLIYDKPGATPKKAEMEMKQKGAMRVVRFTFPPDARGMAVLMRDPLNAWVFLPEFKKTRRISAQQMRQGSYGGSDFTNDDMATGQYAGRFTGRFQSPPTSATAIIELTPTASDAAYDKQVIHVRLADMATEKMEYWQGDKRVRELTAEKFIKLGKGYMQPGRVTMRNLMTGHYTTIDFSDIKADQKLPDSAFTERALQFGR